MLVCDAGAVDSTLSPSARASTCVVSLSSPYGEEDQGDSVAALFASSPVYCTVYTVANQSRHACDVSEVPRVLFLSIHPIS